MAEVRICLYGGCIVPGGFAELEEHAVNAHGAIRHVYPCAEAPCKKVYKTVGARNRHKQNKHGGKLR